MKTTPLDPRIADLEVEQLEIFLSFYIDDEAELQERVERILGIRWSYSDVATIRGAEGTDEELQALPRDQDIIFPLAAVLKPEILIELKQRYGLKPPDVESLKKDIKDPFHGKEGKRGAPWVPEDAESLSHLSQEEFIKKIQGGPQKFGPDRSPDRGKGGFDPR